MVMVIGEVCQYPSLFVYTLYFFFWRVRCRFCTFVYVCLCAFVYINLSFYLAIFFQGFSVGVRRTLYSALLLFSLHIS